ncbi:MAG: hypothetical protein KUG77_30045 [Nannocystaceae bacterium]|nr:hypothetical protein [Nannocystaceae bacterium]
MRIVSLLLLAVAGCSISQAPAEPESVVVTPPAEDGTRYVAVQGDGMSSPQVLARQWKREAKKACEGDYVLINDEPGQTRRRGMVTARMHEGFVRCMIENEELGGTPKRATAKNGR